ncbi:type 4a pilus biogenesis protein PilO [Kineococcus aurantiacus]|uniref:Type IV pilus assembly protein PilO n=1 Tax=Kineococcus aurantiacus TaxID=37633 RepID=A0A7Y9DHY0_9ACTN|nr:type 4a pilus biogenesis protein PilO [Kineococcus aurantiacus]NYD20815.1 type IV pilus assembly protein PilO [Kineococcus aurantiacus]
MTRDKNTVWIAGTAVLAVLVLVATYFLLIAPKRAEAADIATQTLQTRQGNETLQQQIALLQSQFATLGDRRAELAEITRTLPAKADVQQLLRQVETYATTSGVTLLSVTPGSPVLHGVDGTGAAAETSGPLVVDVPITLTTAGSFSGTELFVKQVQADMGRFLSVSDLSLTAGTASDDDGVTATVTGRVFVLRDAQTTEDQSGTAGAAATNGSES